MNLLYHHRTQGIGAEGVHIRGVVDALRRLNCHVAVISPPGIDPFEKSAKAPAEESKEKPGLLSGLASNIPQIFFEFMEIFYNFYSLYALFKAVKKNRIDSIYERYAFFNVSGTIVSKFLKIPVIIEANSSVFMKSHSRSMKLRPVIIWFEKYIFSRADRIITISNNLRQIILDHHELPEYKVVVMSNAIDPIRFNDIDTNMLSAREMYSIKEKYIVGFVGAFVKWHGISFMLSSLHQLLEEKDIHILIVGDGPIRPEIESEIIHLKIGAHVTITGFVDADDVPQYISDMDICVMPDSNTHGSPVKIFEYMAMGKPIVAPAYEPITDVLTDGEDSLIFEPRNSRAFADKISELTENRGLREKLGGRARDKVFQKYTWDNHAERIISLYGQIKSLT